MPGNLTNRSAESQKNRTNHPGESKNLRSQTVPINSFEREPTIPRVLAVFPTQRFHQPPSAAPPPTPTIGTYKPFNSYLVSGHRAFTKSPLQ